MPLQPLLLSLFDPRGRCNRKGLFLAALLMLVVEVLLGVALWVSERPFSDPYVLVVKTVLIYMALSAAAQRLHDLGHSALCLLWASLALFSWAFVLGFIVVLQFPPEQLAAGQLGYSILFVGLLQPMLVMLLWLHFARGEEGPNRYGPVPDGLGFSRRPADELPIAAATA